MNENEYTNLTEYKAPQPKQHYDELQKLTKYKVGYQTLFVALGLMILNGYINLYFTWAVPFAVACIILTISICYFSTVTIFKNAYIADTTRLDLLCKKALLFFIIFTIIAILDYHFGRKHILLNPEDCIAVPIDGFKRYFLDGLTYTGILSSRISYPLLAFNFGYTALMLGIKEHIENKKDRIKSN